MAKKEIDINGAKYSVRKANTTPHASDITINGVTYSINMAKFSIPMNTDNSPLTATYHVSASQHSDKTGALIDCGANGGIMEQTVMSLKKCIILSMLKVSTTM